MNRNHLVLRALLATVAVAFAISSAPAQKRLSPELQEKIDKLAVDTLAKTGVPSASVAVAR